MFNGSMFNVLIVLEQEIGTFIYIFLIILLVKLVEKNHFK
jgi:hypothetical protein